MHGLFVRCWRDFAEDRNMRPARFYRIVNEVPAVLMVLIVILVKVRPFPASAAKADEPPETLIAGTGS